MTTSQAIQAIAPSGTWKSDPVHSNVEFSVKHMEVQTFRGRFDDYEVSLTDASGEPRLSGKVRVDSVDVKDETLKGHLLSPEFFDAERHPEIIFVSREIREHGDGIVVEGDLTINGITKTVEAHGSITEPVQPFAEGAGERIGLALETTVDRTEFGLDWQQELPGGGVVLGNDVTLTVNVELAKEE
jgi:polyisoprenoid-binding protein YceI